MGIIKRAGDLVYTFRFLRLLTMKFEDTEAFKLGIIDADGKRLKSFTLDRMDDRDNYSNYYTPFHRLVFNIKRLMAKAPGGGSKLASYAAALYLIREQYNINNRQIKEALERSGVDQDNFIAEQSEWFVLEDNRLSPGVYRIMNDKILNTSLEDLAFKKDKVRVDEQCYPIGDMFGLNIYEVTHVNTRQPMYVTIGELAR